MIVPVWIAIAAPAGAATLKVGPSETYETILAAVEAASAGDRIEVDAGVYSERPVQIAIDLTIVGVGGSAGTTWEPAQDGLAIRVQTGAIVTIEGFTFVPAEGALVLVEGTLTADDWLVSGATESPLLVSKGTLTLQNSVLDGNTGSAYGGHLVVVEGAATVIDSDLRAGSSPVGGAIYVQSGVLVLDEARLEANHADEAGGAVYLVDSTMSADASLFLGNSASAGWGGSDGGALMLAGTSSLTMTACAVQDNISDETGGGLALADSATGDIDGTSFSGNSSAYGGAIYAGGTGDLTLSDSDFDGNQATSGNGGAIRRKPSGAGTLTVVTSVFLGNTATGYGGAISTASDDGQVGGIVLDEDWFAENSATNGGALSLTNVATVDVSHVVLCANHADEDGGGARVSTSGSAKHEWTNTLFSDNDAGGRGGGLMLTGNGPASVFNDAFLGNEAGLLSGGGISLQDSDVEIINALIAFTNGGNGLTSDLLQGSQIDVTYSAFYDNNLGDLPLLVGGMGNLFGKNPDLAAYSADGDCTNDQPWPVAGSPLVDAGDPTYSDPDGSRSDIGLYGGPQADWSDFEDNDGDGFVKAVDCDDEAADVNPDAPERCNGVDDDCDGAVDVDAVDAFTYWSDGDGDGYGLDGATVSACSAPSGTASMGGDCDDARAEAYPGAPELCNALDDNCDGEADDGLSQTFFPDFDADGYGVGAGTCAPTEGAAELGGDCDDADAAVHPQAEDPPGDGIDSNCDGQDGVAVGEGEDAKEDLLVGGGCTCEVHGIGPGGAWRVLGVALVWMFAWRRRSGDFSRDPGFDPRSPHGTVGG